MVPEVRLQADTTQCPRSGRQRIVSACRRTVSDRMWPTNMRRYWVVLVAVSAAAAGCAAKPETWSTDAGSPLGRAARDIALKSETIVVSARVGAGATLASILRAQNLAAADVQRLLERAASVFDLRKVRTNQPYRLEKTTDGAIRSFEYEIDSDRFLRVSRNAANELDADAAHSERPRRRACRRAHRSLESIAGCRD